MAKNPLSDPDLLIDPPESEKPADPPKPKAAPAKKKPAAKPNEKQTLISRWIPLDQETNILVIDGLGVVIERPTGLCWVPGVRPARDGGLESLPPLAKHKLIPTRRRP